MSMRKMTDPPEKVDWKCAECEETLTPGKVAVTYIKSRFTVELMKCPRCAMVFIPEDLALGKMAEVEKILEDK